MSWGGVMSYELFVASEELVEGLEVFLRRVEETRARKPWWVSGEVERRRVACPREVR